MNVKDEIIKDLLAKYQNESSVTISKQELAEYIRSVNFLEDVLSSSKTAILIVEYETMKYLFCSSGIQKICGYSPDVLMECGPKLTLSLVDPEHLHIYNLFLPETLRFFEQLPMEERGKYTFSFTISLTNKHGKDATVLQQNYFLKWTDNGKPFIKLIMLTDISDYKNNKDIIYFITRHNGLGKNETIRHRNYTTSSDQAVSPRELEILHLISSGYNTNKISEELRIRANTVKNHKKNILKKLGCNNVSHAVSLAASYGFIKRPIDRFNYAPEK